MSDGLWFTDEQIKRELERGRFTDPTQEKIFRMRLLQDWQRLQAELDAVNRAGQRDAALAVSLYQENQQLKAALDGTHLAFVRASEELQQAREATCEWSRDDDWDENIWESACGLAWSLEDDGPVENDMIYCPKCGKRLVVLPTPPEQDATE